MIRKDSNEKVPLPPKLCSSRTQSELSLASFPSSPPLPPSLLPTPLSAEPPNPPRRLASTRPQWSSHLTDLTQTGGATVDTPVTEYATHAAITLSPEPEPTPSIRAEPLFLHPGLDRPQSVSPPPFLRTYYDTPPLPLRSFGRSPTRTRNPLHHPPQALPSRAPPRPPRGNVHRNRGKAPLKLPELLTKTGASCPSMIASGISTQLHVAV